jgi:hypothetical protein
MVWHGPSASRAWAEEHLPPDVQISVLMTALAYDNALQTQRKPALRIGVVHHQRDRTSQAEAKGIHEEILKLGNKTVRGLHVSSVLIEANNAQDVQKACSNHNINALYLTTGLNDILGPILAFASANRILTMTGERDIVQQGAAIGVYRHMNRPRLIVNMRAALSQGSDLDVRLFQLVEVVQ